MAIRKDKRLWIYDDKIQGIKGSYVGKKMVESNTEKQAFKIRYIPLKDANRSWMFKLYNMVAPFLDALGKDTMIQETPFKVTQEGINRLNPDKNNDTAGVPETIIQTTHDIHGDTDFGGSEAELRKKLADKEEKISDLNKEIDALEGDKKTVENRLEDEKESTGSSNRGRSGMEYFPEGGRREEEY